MKATIFRIFSKSITLSIFLATLAWQTNGATLYVSLLGTNPVPPYADWSTAATNIQDAVDAAMDGDQVAVTNGHYVVGGWAVYGLMTNRVAINKAVAVRSLNGPLLTIIEGSESAGGGFGDGAIRCAYVGTNAVLSGFTLTNGHTRTAGDFYKEKSGGGVWCELSGVVSNCILSGNSAYHYGGGAYYGTLNDCMLAGNWAQIQGGGVYRGTLNNCTLTNNVVPSEGGGAYQSTLNHCMIVDNVATYGAGAYGGTLTNCTLAHNRATFGGGAYLSTLDNCTLTGNWASNEGGGVSGGRLSNCTLTGNWTSGDGGGVRGGILQNCTLTGNSATYSSGGGAYNGSLNNCTLTGNSARYGGGACKGSLNNCTLTDNSATSYGGGACNGTLSNSIVYFNIAPTSSNHTNSSFYYSCTIPLPAGTCNFTDLPRFINQGEGNLRLQSNSPCINGGNNTYARGSTDLDGNPRISGGTVDIGAYEFQGPGSILSYAYLQQYGLPCDGSADYLDPDSDGWNNCQEWIAGTNPTNPASFLRMVSVSQSGHDKALFVSWAGGVGKNYCLQRSTNLTGIPAFSTIASNLIGNGDKFFTNQDGTFTYTDRVLPGPVFYRVGVQP